jgi:hypothetical protein
MEVGTSRIHGGLPGIQLRLGETLPAPAGAALSISVVAESRSYM